MERKKLTKPKTTKVSKTKPKQKTNKKPKENKATKTTKRNGRKGKNGGVPSQHNDTNSLLKKMQDLSLKVKVKKSNLSHDTKMGNYPTPISKRIKWADDKLVTTMIIPNREQLKAWSYMKSL